MENIIVKNLWKKFCIGIKKEPTALARFVSSFSGKEPRKIFWTLKDISFKVKQGEIVGIIGNNGSGKSTLLKIIAGIYNKSGGKVITKGKVVFIGTELGLNFSLNVIDNIFLSCSLMGLKKEEIKKRIKEIISFAELENFAYTKLYQFSSGMILRLAFSIAVHSAINNKPDILLIDEILSAGDQNFEEKCFEKMKKLKQMGSTILIVSHDSYAIQRNCDRIIWMEDGKIKKEGGMEIASEYYGKYKKDLRDWSS